MKHEKILNVFPSSSDHSRLVVASQTTFCGKEVLVLRQESFAPDVGWYAQSSVPIEQDQVAGLKMTLTSNVGRQKKSPATGGGVAILKFSDAVAS